MVSLALVLAAFIGIIMTSAVVYIIYKVIYDRHNNRILEEGPGTKKRWISPLILLCIVFGIQAVAWGAVAAATGLLTLYKTDTQTKEESHYVRVVGTEEYGDTLGVMVVTDGFEFNGDYSPADIVTEEGISSFRVYTRTDPQTDDTNGVGVIVEYEGDPADIDSVYLEYSFDEQESHQMISTQTYIAPEVIQGTDIVGTVGSSVGYPGELVFKIFDEDGNCLAECRVPVS